MKTPTKSNTLDSKGLLWGFSSYCMWGFFPLYWKLLHGRSSLEILSHRFVWSFLFYVAIFIFFSGRSLRSLVNQHKREWLLSALAAGLLAVNWGIYIYAVNTGRIMEGSLAYFINPILNVVVGVAFFKEPFPLILKLSALCAALGVGWKVLASPTFPSIPLLLALTFCAYGIVKKSLKAPPLSTSVMEGCVGFVPALLGVLYFQNSGGIVSPPLIWALFIGAGIVTGLPLFLFSFAAQRIPYSVMGMLQFIAPTLQFLVAVLVYQEPFGPTQVLSFGLIWVGVLFYLSFQLEKLRRGLKS